MGFHSPKPPQNQVALRKARVNYKYCVMCGKPIVKGTEYISATNCTLEGHIYCFIGNYNNQNMADAVIEFLKLDSRLRGNDKKSK